ncbi:hypothetical protein DPMN_004995 [Dreissena polymorpha]|uniref:HAT C-terminal dimerisation domain-containing protein n=1 Tax=Dreissena polymorpha TaxID=45954 RepID=A0A9D4RTH0_DREPO|nr:hypothetical protein DPMN_004995 [Dreissena polymorpha]
MRTWRLTPWAQKRWVGEQNLQYLLVLPCMQVSTASAERSCTMRQVKTCLRSTMGTERMSGLALLTIHREREIDLEEVVDVFARRKERRLALLFRV